MSSQQAFHIRHRHEAFSPTHPGLWETGLYEASRAQAVELTNSSFDPPLFTQGCRFESASHVAQLHCSSRVVQVCVDEQRAERCAKQHARSQLDTPFLSVAPAVFPGP
jgi:hypothetical protein